MRKIILFIVLGISSFVYSQNLQIHGSVRLEDNSGDFYYNLLIYTLTPDTVLVSGGSFQTKDFKITIPTQNLYLIRLSAMGYQTKDIMIKSDHVSTLDLGELELVAVPISLGSVTITAKQPIVKMKTNKLVVNVKNTTLSSAGNLTDMLKRTPGLVQNGENSIVVPGRGEPLIIIDDKEVKNRDILNSLSSNDIESIEIIRAPSSEYAANVKSVVHIKTIKRLKDNVYLQVANTLSANSKLSTVPSVQFRIKKGIVSSMINYNYADMNNVIHETYYKYIYHPTYTFTSFSDAKLRSGNQVHRILWATDIDINKKNNIGFQYFFQNSDRIGRMYNKNEINDEQEIRKRTISQKDLMKGNIHSISLNYNYNISKTSSIIFVTDYASINSNIQGRTNEQNDITKSISQVNIDNNSKYNVYTAALKYKFELYNKIQTNIGIQYSNVNNPSKVLTNNRQKIIPAHTRLKDQVTALYFNLSKDWNAFNIQLGFRYEYAKSNIHTKSNTMSIVNRSYSDLFPNIEMSYKINEDFDLTLNLSRYIERPTFGELNPSIFYEDSLSYTSGNPFVKPAYSNEISLSGLWKNLSLSITYTNVKDLKTQTVISDEKNVNITKMIPINLHRSEAFTANLSYSFNKKSFSLYSSVGIELPFQKIPYLNEIRKINKLSWNCSMNCEYNISRHFTLHGDFFYNSANESMLTYQYATNALNLGIRGVFLNEKLMVDLYGTDLLRGSNFNNLYDRYLNIKSGTRGKGDARGIALRVSYVLFNKNKVSVKSQRGNSEVIERTN